MSPVAGRISTQTQIKVCKSYLKGSQRPNRGCGHGSLNLSDVDGPKRELDDQEPEEFDEHCLRGPEEGESEGDEEPV